MLKAGPRRGRREILARLQRRHVGDDARRRTRAPRWCASWRARLVALRHRFEDSADVFSIGMSGLPAEIGDDARRACWVQANATFLPGVSARLRCAWSSVTWAVKLRRDQLLLADHFAAEEFHVDLGLGEFGPACRDNDAFHRPEGRCAPVADPARRRAAAPGGNGRSVEPEQQRRPAATGWLSCTGISATISRHVGRQQRPCRRAHKHSSVDITVPAGAHRRRGRRSARTGSKREQYSAHQAAARAARGFLRVEVVRGATVFRAGASGVASPGRLRRRICGSAILFAARPSRTGPRAGRRSNWSSSCSSACTQLFPVRHRECRPSALAARDVAERRRMARQQRMGFRRSDRAARCAGRSGAGGARFRPRFGHPVENAHQRDGLDIEQGRPARPW